MLEPGGRPGLMPGAENIILKLKKIRNYEG
jgi:hypothetical protein